MRGADHLAAEHRADDELRARADGAMHGLGIEHRAGAEQKIRRQRRRYFRNQLDRARHGHRHFQRADAAFGERIDDGAQRGWIRHANNRHDTEFFDFCDSFRSRSSCHKPGMESPPSTLMNCSCCVRTCRRAATSRQRGPRLRARPIALRERGLRRYACRTPL